MPAYATGYSPALFFGLLFRVIIHDMSKFRPSEFFPYADFFYGKHSIKQNGLEVKTLPNNAIQMAFDVAWLKHIHRNPHHWQYWVLREDIGRTKVLNMPKVYALEMLCDWQGASKAIRGTKADAWDWYMEEWQKMTLGLETRDLVEDVLRSW
jgi:hypothetical protein